MIPIARPTVGEEEKALVLEVLESGKLAQGEMVARLEDEFAAYCGAKHAVATSNGTTALHLADAGPRPRPRRRSDHRAIHLHRLGQLDCLCRRAPGVHRHRARTAITWTPT